jgi:predicted transcriptional regulator
VSATQRSSPGEGPASAATAADGATWSQRDPAAVRQFIERFTSHLVQTGFPRTPARIFVALLTADSSSMTAAELGEILEASPASVSGGARYLVQVGLIVAEGEAGSRRQHYRMPETIWQDIVGLRERQFIRWSADLSEGVQVLGGDSPAGVRMAQAVRYFEFITGEIAGLLARWQEQSGQGARGRPGSSPRD